MVLDYYKLREQPFGVTPDSRFLYASATHREALASLLYAVQVGRGFAALIAKPGMGKTTLLFRALQQLQNRAKVVFLFQTIYTPHDFLRAVLADLGVSETQGSFIDLQVKLNEVLMELSRSGKPLVVIIDEAQNLDDSVLELVRMLSNFETSREKLMQIILSGQPQLADKLASPELVQLRQRISIFACLKPLSSEETALYIDHRLRMAGYSAEAALFTPGALEMIAKCSEGIPRNINNLCFNALSLGCALKRETIDRDILSEVVADLDLDPLREKIFIAPRREENAAQSVPALISVPMRASLMSNAWLRKLAMVCVVLVCVVLAAWGSVLFQGHRRMAPKAAGVVSGVPPLTTVNSGVQRTPQLTAAGLIRVTPGQTLYWICVENFGSCNPKRLHEIRTLNPWLSDINHIEPGQTIRVPVVDGVSRHARNVAEQSWNASSARRGTQ